MSIFHCARVVSDARAPARGCIRRRGWSA
jgi:hypothetical protein